MLELETGVWKLFIRNTVIYQYATNIGSENDNITSESWKDFSCVSPFSWNNIIYSQSGNIILTVFLITAHPLSDNHHYRKTFINGEYATMVLLNTGYGRNNSHILKVYKNQTNQGTENILLFIKSTYDAIFFRHF